MQMYLHTMDPLSFMNHSTSFSVALWNLLAVEISFHHKSPKIPYLRCTRQTWCKSDPLL